MSSDLAANNMKINRKDGTEDITFVEKKDFWGELSDYYGEPFKEYRRMWKEASHFQTEVNFPLQIDFELNNTCNFKCDFCTFSIDKVKKAIYFPEDKFKAIVTEGVKKGLRAIEFSYINEPLIRRDLPELIRFAKDAGVVDLSFNTNASLLTEEVGLKLLDSGLTRIQFSLDAHSAEVFNVVRAGGNYDKVIANILRFLELKKEKNAKGLMTAVSFIRMNTNEHQWEAFVDYWTEKVDYIILREYLVPVAPDNEHYEEKKKLNVQKKHINKEFRCDMPWNRLVIRGDGTTLPCCAFHGSALPVGNAFEQSVEDIWKSTQMRGLREIHKAGEYYKNKVCRDCAQACTVESVI